MNVKDALKAEDFPSLMEYTHFLVGLMEDKDRKIYDSFLHITFGYFDELLKGYKSDNLRMKKEISSIESRISKLEQKVIGYGNRV